MERKRGIIMSYHAPDRNYIWLDPSVNMFKNFEDGLWKPVATNIAYSKIENLILELQKLNLLIENKQDKLVAGSGITIAEDGKTIFADGGKPEGGWAEEDLNESLKKKLAIITPSGISIPEDDDFKNTTYANGTIFSMSNDGARVQSLGFSSDKNKPVFIHTDGANFNFLTRDGKVTVNGQEIALKGDILTTYDELLNKPFEWSTVQIKHPTADGIIVDVPYVTLSELSGGVDLRDTSAIVFSDIEEDLANILDKKADKDAVETFEEEVRTALNEDSGKIVKYCTINDIDNIPAIASDVAAMKSAVRKGTCMNYIVQKKKSPSRIYVVGTIEMFIDDMEHCITLIFRTNYTLTEDGQIDTGHSHLLSEYVRYYNLSWDSTDYYKEEWPIGTWTKWRNIKNI